MYLRYQFTPKSSALGVLPSTLICPFAVEMRNRSRPSPAAMLPSSNCDARSCSRRLSTARSGSRSKLAGAEPVVAAAGAAAAAVADINKTKAQPASEKVEGVPRMMCRMTCTAAPLPHRLRVPPGRPGGWLGSHHEIQPAPGFDLRVADHRRIERFAVELRRLDIHVARGIVRRRNLECLAVRQAQNHAGEERAADHVVGGGRVERIEAHGRKYVPGGHLSAILISEYAVGGVGISVPGNFPHACLRLPGLSRVVVQISIVMAGFVVVAVVAAVEMLIQFGGGGFPAAQ